MSMDNVIRVRYKTEDGVFHLIDQVFTNMTEAIDKTDELSSEPGVTSAWMEM